MLIRPTADRIRIDPYSVWYRRKHSARVNRRLEAFPSTFRQRILVLTGNSATLADALNAGLAAVSGSYFSVVRPSDLVFDHWFSTFSELSSQCAGAILRASCVTQSYSPLASGGPRSTNPYRACFSRQFKLVNHLLGERSPSVCIALPRSLAKLINFKFYRNDWRAMEWELLATFGQHRQVIEAKDLTSICRSDFSSDKLESKISNEALKEAVRDFSRRSIVLPPGDFRELQIILMQGHTSFSGPSLHSSGQLQGKIDDLQALYHSSSWRITRPIRRLQKLVTGHEYIEMPAEELSERELMQAISNVKRSLSWRLSAPLRRLKK